MGRDRESKREKRRKGRYDAVTLVVIQSWLSLILNCSHQGPALIADDVPHLPHFHTQPHTQTHACAHIPAHTQARNGTHTHADTQRER